MGPATCFPTNTTPQLTSRPFCSKTKNYRHRLLANTTAKTQPKLYTQQNNTQISSIIHILNRQQLASLPIPLHNSQPDLFAPKRKIIDIDFSQIPPQKHNPSFILNKIILQYPLLYTYLIASNLLPYQYHSTTHNQTFLLQNEKLSTSTSRKYHRKNTTQALYSTK